MEISIGDELPDVSFKIMKNDEPVDVTVSEIFSGKKIVLFCVPGAFTPTCHRITCWDIWENLDAIKAKDVDEVAVVAVNDVWVMDSWAKATKGEGKIIFLADGSAEFAKAVGMDVDLNAVGMGIRSKRYSMIVEDRKVTSLNIEQAPGTAVRSGAATILSQL